MRVLPLAGCALLLTLASLANARPSWSFEDANVTIQGKGTGVGSGFSKEKLLPSSPLTKPLSFAAADTLKITLTTTEGGAAKRPHQAFLTLQEPTTGLEESFLLTLKGTGRGRVEVTHKDLPAQFLASSHPLKASLVIASFGSSSPLMSAAFDLAIKRDPSAPAQAVDGPLRYGKLDEIHHVFRSDPKSPPRVISLFFTAAALATFPALLIGWSKLGANLNHLGEATGHAPLAHVSFLGSLLQMEIIFFLYYHEWNLFQMLPAAAAAGLVAFLSGSRALSEVQARRLAGKR